MQHIEEAAFIQAIAHAPSPLLLKSNIINKLERQTNAISESLNIMVVLTYNLQSKMMKFT